MIKAKYTQGDNSQEFEFDSMDELLKYERLNKRELSYQHLPESFDKEHFRNQVDDIKETITERFKSILESTKADAIDWDERLKQAESEGVVLNTINKAKEKITWLNQHFRVN